ncbi:M15 family metallopeptidase [Phytohabitans flavus]|uniref:D-alanyl-D-alanine dipeptidase n=1 Tax=Phytohabitans flavus TaxID=1076124 RepID=A0A6F8XSY8_9ACTN|nr:M15 family metallopeptidase [Phytohabitans flavus]BCB76861.1 D-alanyl-D-alanine dipeptidase [Phytohabitans flavus]
MTADTAVLLSDPRIAAIPVGDSDEPLTDLNDVPEVRLDGRYADAAGAYGHLRKGVLARLLDAHRLLPDGLRFLVTEGYRPLDRQQAIFDGYRDELRQRHPEWEDERLFVEASKFVSPVGVAPHSTGGALDLTLVADDGEELDMGTPIDATPLASDNACFTAATNISLQAQRHRRILSTALTRVGFVNYPTEWWHWSFGDRYWAFVTHASKTQYGPIAFTPATHKNGN